MVSIQRSSSRREPFSGAGYTSECGGEGPAGKWGSVVVGTSRKTVVVAACVAAATAAAMITADGAAAAGGTHHVLLLSVDGMHQADLTWYVAHHPQSALAGLVGRGSQFTAAATPFPSDSFPGLLGQLTGGNPRTTGIFYDVTYNHALIDPAASASAVPSQSLCASAPLGANVPFDESLDRDTSRLDAGQGLPNLPSDILQMTNAPQTLIDPTTLPIDPATCTRVYPHSYLKVNTVFEVAKSHGLGTAWSDKHPAYEILNGPSGGGVDDLFTPEINSDANAAGDSWTSVNSLTQQYDRYKVESVVNEIRGRDHSGQFSVGMPAVFGMNFQSVSTAQKLPVSDGLPGGYNLAGTEPGPVLRDALDFVDQQVGAMVTALARSGHAQDTTIIVSAKHGQSPMDGASLKRIDDGAIIDALNAAWLAQYPARPQPLVAASLNDDGMLLWFSNGDQTPVADRFAAAFLCGPTPATAPGPTGRPRPPTSTPRRSPTTTPGWTRSTPARRPRSSFAPQRPTAACQTSSASYSTESSTPARPPRSPSMAETTRRTGTYPSWSPVPGSRTRAAVRRWRPPRSLPRSWPCWA